MRKVHRPLNTTLLFPALIQNRERVGAEETFPLTGLRGWFSSRRGVLDLVLLFTLAFPTASSVHLSSLDWASPSTEWNLHPPLGFGCGDEASWTYTPKWVPGMLTCPREQHFLEEKASSSLRPLDVPLWFPPLSSLPHSLCFCGLVVTSLWDRFYSFLPLLYLLLVWWQKGCVI